MAWTRLVVAMLAMQAVMGAALAAEGAREAEFVDRLRAFMTTQRAASMVDAARIRATYGEAAAREALPDRHTLVQSLRAGRIAPLPPHARLLNVQPRIGGVHPIGERDLHHQDLYVAAHPAALGCLLHVAASVRSGPLDVTSLVRHLDYQRALRSTNPNAATDIPVHALGLAFDISVLNVPLATAKDIHEVLVAMRNAGDLFFIAETRQFVFHVVPAPGRLAFYRSMFEALMSLPPPQEPLGVDRQLQAEAGLDSGWRQADAVTRLSGRDRLAMTIGTGALLLALAGVVVRTRRSAAWTA